MGTPLPQNLMSEDDVRFYFIKNGGIVRNNDIVTYFRAYLSNPSIRDEARALFKSFVNKLATVKVENGEKYLVLKRQFYPIGFQGRDSAMSTPTHAPAPAPFTQYPYQGPPPYITTGGFPPQNQPSFQTASNYTVPPNSQVQVPQPSASAQTQYFNPPIQQQLPSNMSRSQPSLYGSHFSLNSSSGASATSTYTDPYLQQQQLQQQLQQQQVQSTYGGYPGQGQGQGHAPVSVPNAQATDYPMEYGLPPPPPAALRPSPPRRLSFSSPSSSNFSGSISSPGRTPPPYRAPPPAYMGPPLPSNYGTPSPNYATSPIQANLAGRSPVNFRSPPTGEYFGQAGPVESPTRAQYRTQYRRSLSASGLSGVPNVVIKDSVTNPTCASAGDTSINPFFVGVGTPPPPVPPRAKRLSSALDRSPDSSTSSGGGRGFTMEDYNKENANPVIIVENESARGQNSTNTTGNINSKEDEDDSPSSGGMNGNGSSNGSEENTENENSELEQKISVKERMQKFNRIASEGEMPLVPKNGNGNAKNRRDIVSSKHESADYDTASLSSYGYGFQAEPKAREWILKAVRLDYHAINKMAQENPSLVKRRDINYTALHWAAKHGHIELVKLLAGTFNSDVNAKSNGGYTPLHLAAQFSRQDVYDILVKAYNADAGMRDHSGKKPMQYMVRQDSTAVSMDTFKKLKEKRRSTELQRDRDRERDSSFLRIGSLNVRVKKTTEAFGNFLGKSPSASHIERVVHKNWGSADHIQDSETGHDKDKEMMPPPNMPRSRASSSSSKSRKSKARRSLQIPNSESSSIQETQSDSESDTACGFGSEWANTS